MEEINNEHVITLFEACEMLNKSARTVSRYVRKGLLNPMYIKSRKGTQEYRFSRVELEGLKDREDEIRQTTFVEDEAPDPAVARFATVDAPAVPPEVSAPFIAPDDPVLQEAPDMPDKTGQTGQADTNPPLEVLRDSGAGVKQEARDEQNRSGTEIDYRGEIENAINDASARQSVEIISLLKETTGMLRDQLQVKDEQIKSLNDKIDNLIERDRETNILLKGLQDKFLYLEKPKADSGRSHIEKAEINEVPVSPAKPAKENKDETKGKNNKKTNSNLSGNKDNNKNSKERQDTTDKQNNQKKVGSDKPKKGFWGGLFGK